MPCDLSSCRVIIPIMTLYICVRCIHVDGGGLGRGCGVAMMVLSITLIVLTFPFSLCVCIKVSKPLSFLVECI